MFEKLSGSFYFITLRSGKYEFNLMPFVLTNAVATFCTLMDKLFAGYGWDFIICFTNNCRVSTQDNFDVHLVNLENIFIQVQAANMRLKLSKCHFAAAELPFLNHIVGRFGLKMDPAKVNKLKLIKFLVNKKQVRQFLGLAGFFRDFIKNFAEIAVPLSNLTRDAHPDNFELATFNSKGSSNYS